MGWEEVFRIVVAFLMSIGVGGAIVAAVGNLLVGRLRGKIDERLARLDAALQHRGFVLQRFAEYELEAIVECWRAARTCLPLINSARPLDSGDGPEAEDTLTSAYSALSNGHNILIENIGRHEPFLPDAIVQTLDTLSQVLRFEMSNIRHHPHFQGTWWTEAAENQRVFAETCSQLQRQVRQRTSELREQATTE